MKGRWFPVKALGVGNDSFSSLSSSISSKLRVSVSPTSSGTTGATATKNGLLVNTIIQVNYVINKPQKN